MNIQEKVDNLAERISKEEKIRILDAIFPISHLNQAELVERYKDAPALSSDEIIIRDSTNFQLVTDMIARTLRAEATLNEIFQEGDDTKLTKMIENFREIVEFVTPKIKFAQEFARANI